jgi:hypothetical protein
MFAIFMLFLSIAFLSIGIYYFRESKDSAKSLNKLVWIGAGCLFLGVFVIWVSQSLFEDNFNIGTLILCIGIGLVTIGIVCSIIAIYSSPRKGCGIVFLSIGVILLLIGLITLLELFPVPKWIREELLISPNKIIFIIIAILIATSAVEFLKAVRRGHDFPAKRWFFICLTIFIIIVFIEPYAQNLFFRMRGLKTPWFEAELDPMVEKNRLINEDQQEYLERINAFFKALQFEQSIENVIFIMKIKIIETKTKKLTTNDSNTKKKLEEDLNNLQVKIKSYYKFIEALKRIGFFEFLQAAHSTWYKNVGEGLIRQKAMCWVAVLKQIFEKERFDLQFPCFDEIPNDIGDNAELIRKNVAYYHILLAYLLDFSEDLNGAKRLLTEYFAESSKRQNCILEVERLAIHGYLGYLTFRSSDRFVKEGLENAIECQEIAFKANQSLIGLFSRLNSEVSQSLENMRKISPEKSREVDNLLKDIDANKYRCQDLLKDFKGIEIILKNELAFKYAMALVKEHKARQFIEDLKVFDFESTKQRALSYDTIGYVYIRFYTDQDEVRTGLYWLKEAENEAYKIETEFIKFFTLITIRNHINFAKNLL